MPLKRLLSPVKLLGWPRHSREPMEPLLGQGACRRALGDFGPATAHWSYRAPAAAITVGFAVASALLPTSATGGLRAALAVGGVIGGAAIVGLVTLLVLLIIAPRRQRDEARAEIRRLRKAAEVESSTTRGAAPEPDPTVAQVERLAEIIDDGTCVLATNDMADAFKWARVTSEDLLDLTGRQAEANMFERAGIGARNSGGFISRQASAESQINHLRDKVDPKLREGYWPNSPFCERERELGHRPGDRDEEAFVIDRLRSGYRLRHRIRSATPPPNDEVGTWVGAIVRGFSNRAQPTLGERIVRDPDGQDGDAISPPGGWEVESTYLDSRLDALWAILRELRQQRHDDS